MLDRNEAQEANRLARDARKRLNAHASINKIDPPVTILDPDGAPSRSLLDYCRNHNLTLDWVFLGEGPKHRSGFSQKGTQAWRSSTAYELLGLVEICRMAFDNDGLQLPKECWSIGQTLETVSRLTEELLDAVERIGMDRRNVTPEINQAVRTVADARQKLDDAVSIFNEMDLAGGVGNAEAQAYQEATVYPVMDAAQAAEMALLGLQAETVGDFLRKVSTLCRSGENDEVYDALRLEADRLLEKA